MTHDEKLELDLRDFQRIREGLETYAKLDAKAAMERLKDFTEDGPCHVSDYSGRGTLMCTREGYNAIIQLAQRHRDFLAVPDDYSVSELVEAIKKLFVRVTVEAKEERVAVVRVLSEAISEANKNHIQRTYHFPCVIVPFEEPHQFSVGAVVFTAVNMFLRTFDLQLQQWVKESSDENFSSERVRRFQEYISNFGWVASVAVPPCAVEAAKSRAERAATTAINLLRLLFGVTHGRDMRVAHVAYTRPSNIEYAVTENGKFDLFFSRKTSGALVEDDWYLSMRKWPEFWNRAAHLIATTITGKRSEISYRVGDALTWFGDSAFEPAPGKQIVNFVAALERLTTTESFSTHKFCSRVAILASEIDTFEKTYWDAYAIHSARSEVIHGAFSPRSEPFLRNVRLAHDVTRNALFRGLEIHSHLDAGGKLSTLDDLQNFFTQQHSKRASVLEKLNTELKTLKRKSGNHP